VHIFFSSGFQDTDLQQLNDRLCLLFKQIRPVAVNLVRMIETLFCVVDAVVAVIVIVIFYINYVPMQQYFDFKNFFFAQFFNGKKSSWS
jgi:hypothetical protein